MKIAIAKDGSAVSGHFGHCEGFALYTGDNDTVTFVGDLKNSEGHSTAASLLASQGVTLVLSGGMGQRARDILQEQGIVSILGVQGQIESIAKEFFAGTISDSAPLCNHSGCNDPVDKSAGTCTCSCHQK
ncbi:MAG TPA: NifB/NifX family molybdenum-iron cluster-binding protein [Methanospirillum sp.]|nr:NifB/NifX family molybdenum-iron cluster-binding protein [Methanospirillum sp.]